MTFSRPMLFVLLAAMGLTLLGTGCGWSPRNSFSHEVFSTDETRIAGVERYWEAQCNVFGMCSPETEHKRNFEFAVWTRDVPELGLSPSTFQAPGTLSQRFSGYVDSLHYVHNENHHYVVVNTRTYLKDYSIMERDFVVYLLRLNGSGVVTGSPTELFRGTRVARHSCNSSGSTSSGSPVVSGIPSGDGSVIALVETHLSCEQVRIEASFLNASSLAPIGDSVDIYNVTDANLRMDDWHLGWFHLGNSDTRDLETRAREVLTTEVLLREQSRATPLYGEAVSNYWSHHASQQSSTAFEQVFMARRSLSNGGEAEGSKLYVVSDTVQVVDVVDLYTADGFLDYDSKGNRQFRFRSDAGSSVVWTETIRGDQHSDDANPQFKQLMEVYAGNRHSYAVDEEPGLEIRLDDWDLAWSWDKSGGPGAEPPEGIFVRTYWAVQINNPQQEMLGEWKCLDYSPQAGEWTSSCDMHEEAIGQFGGEELMWSRMAWLFDEAGKLRACLVYGATRAQAEARSIDGTDLSAGCEGSAWLSLSPSERLW